MTLAVANLESGFQKMADMADIWENSNCPIFALKRVIDNG